MADGVTSKQARNSNSTSSTSKTRKSKGKIIVFRVEMLLLTMPLNVNGVENGNKKIVLSKMFGYTVLKCCQSLF